MAGVSDILDEMKKHLSLAQRLGELGLIEALTDAIAEIERLRAELKLWQSGLEYLHGEWVKRD